MLRHVIQIARIRLVDVRRGDVVNARPDADQGWFVVREVRKLGNGTVVAMGATTAASAKGAGHDLVGLQVVKHVDVASTPNQPAPHADASIATAPGPGVGGSPPPSQQAVSPTSTATPAPPSPVSTPAGQDPSSNGQAR